LKLEKVHIIGLGYVGLPLAISAAKSGYRVVGYDINRVKVQNLIIGKTDSPEVSNFDLLELQQNGLLQITHKLEKHSEPGIYIIAVPTPLNSELEPDLSMLESACDIISNVISNESLVINESTSFVGTLSNFIRPRIISKSKVDNVDFAVAPERIDPANKKWNLQSTPRIIGGISNRSVNRAVHFYKNFCENLITVSKPEVAEAAKLFENTFRQVNIALVNELSSIAQAYNLSTHEIITAASSKPYGFMPFYPSIGVGGHCIPIDPYYLTFSANSLGIETPLISLANEINRMNPLKILERITRVLNNDIIGKNIQIAGITYKPNVPDLRESPILEVINQLQTLGCNVYWHDPLIDEWKDQRSSELRTDIDLGIINTPHDCIDFTRWKDSGLKVIDLSASAKNFGWAKFL